MSDPTTFNCTLLPIPVPGVLPRALGYIGHHRWLACWWEPSGDEFRIYDGALECDGNWSAWLAYSDHVAVRSELSRYNLGSSDMPATHYLLIDLHLFKIYAGLAVDVRRFLAASYPPSRAWVNLHAGKTVWADLASRPGDFQKWINFRRHESAELIEELRRSLDALAPDRIRCAFCGQDVPRSDPGYRFGAHGAHFGIVK